MELSVKRELIFVIIFEPTYLVPFVLHCSLKNGVREIPTLFVTVCPLLGEFRYMNDIFLQFARFDRQQKFSNLFHVFMTLQQKVV